MKVGGSDEKRISARLTNINQFIGGQEGIERRKDSLWKITGQPLNPNNIYIYIETDLQQQPLLLATSPYRLQSLHFLQLMTAHSKMMMTYWIYISRSLERPAL